jgi:hypothetical protein
MTDVDIFSDANSEESTQGKHPSGTATFGLLLIAVGATWLLTALDVVDLSWRTIMSGALILVGVALVAGSRRGTHGGLITAGVILTVVLGLASTAEGILDVPFSGGIGNSTFTPASVLDRYDTYRLAIGDLTVDLRSTDLSEGTTTIEASVAIGQLRVELPRGVAVQVVGSVGAGRLMFDGQEYSGTGVDEIVTDAGFDAASPRLILQVQVGLGNIEVDR